MSFMGKGVTKNAIICLLHLSHEMIAEGKDKDKDKVKDKVKDKDKDKVRATNEMSQPQCLSAYFTLCKYNNVPVVALGMYKDSVCPLFDFFIYSGLV